jgi:glycosyltransferase involved in cell wall biosynthesis
MAMGCPIVASDRTSIPEVLGDAGRLVDPTDPADLADGLNRMLEDETFRHDCIERGLERVQTFSWKRCAEETLEVYRDVLSDD